MKILVTGAAGFIGYALARRLLEQGHEVIGVDNLTEYYDVTLKKARLAELAPFKNFKNIHLDISDRTAMAELMARDTPEVVAHLAAQAGVRYSLTHPQAYVDSNLVGFANVIEGCRQNSIQHLVYASTSAVYGANTQLPFSVHHTADHPVSFYAATKRANELMAHSYSHVFGLPTTGLRFFTVYGPWGRPDMALFLFTQKILKGEPIEVFNYGKHVRDFTFVDDITEGVSRVLLGERPKGDAFWDSDQPDPASSSAPYRIYNIGNNHPVELLRYIEVLEDCLGKKAEKNMLPMQSGDLAETFADVSDLVRDYAYQPSTSIETGVRRFVEWYRKYYKV